MYPFVGALRMLESWAMKKQIHLQKQQPVINIIRCPLPVNDLYPIICSVMLDAWQFFWDLENQKMSEIAKSVRPWKYYPMVRKHEVILARLRIGHS